MSPSSQPQISKNTRIGIIGGGASGIGAAYFLKENGYKNVTVFEKESDVGGKCHTVTIDGDTYNPGTYDTAAIVALPQYKLVQALCNKFNIGLSPIMPKAPTVLGDNFSFFQKAKALFKYTQICTRYKKFIDSSGFVDIEKDPVLSSNYPTFSRENGLEALIPFFNLLSTIFGRGDPEQFLTGNLFRIYPPKFLFLYSLSSIPIIGRVFQSYCPPFYTLTEGYQSLVRKMSTDLSQARVLLNSSVMHINYEDDKKITLSYSINGEEEKENLSEKFDKLIVAIPPDNLVNLTYCNDEQKKLFGQIEYYPFSTALIKFESPLKDQDYNKTDKDYRGVGIAAIGCLSEQDLIYLSGAYTVNKEDMEKRISSFSQKIGIAATILDYPGIVKWPDNHAHVSLDSARRGFYTKLNKMQGIKSTYYVGETLAGKGVESVLGNTKELIDLFFPKLK